MYTHLVDRNRRPAAPSPGPPMVRAGAPIDLERADQNARLLKISPRIPQEDAARW
ncbi:MAG: hypothetical protein HS111_23730 [Kofleriaceae bacterium]|nr:hypothetical protein [Kofleriaceae bacterium]